ncbi:MAG TPA: lactate racemase domain-containing protein [Planctomycetota bacterium]|nr:lactate racemase domain-containing protein [Planctomycetota bacterium]
MPVNCELEFGRESLRLRLPDGADVLAMKGGAPLADPGRTVRESLARPVAGPGLAELARARRGAGAPLTAAVVISDNTRPVPYRGADGILEPILEILRAGRVERIVILVANGTHRALADSELRAMLCPAAFAPGVEVVNHVCTDRASLKLLGRTARGTDAWINRIYAEAGLKILTGLVEPHFIAGASGGPKAVCPGLVGEDVTRVFHGPALLADPRSTSLRLDDNPCQDEARAVAAMAGSDFIVNVTLDGARRVTGVFSGELGAAHAAAVGHLLAVAGVPFEREYDLVVTHAGFVGVNHYQTAKAAVEGVKAVRPGGRLVIAANHTEAEPVGSANYRRALRCLAESGPEGLVRKMLAPGWEFIPEQWQAQLWAQSLAKLGTPANLTYCSPRLTGEAFRAAGLPGTDGGDGLASAAGASARDLAEAMVQRAVDRFAAASPGGRVAVLADGPYGVPVPAKGERP